MMIVKPRFQNGFSLIELLTGVAVGGVVLLGLSQVIGLSNKTAKDSQIDVEILNLVAETRDILSHPASCSTTLNSIGDPSQALYRVRDEDENNFSAAILRIRRTNPSNYVAGKPVIESFEIIEYSSNEGIFRLGIRKKPIISGGAEKLENKISFYDFPISYNKRPQVLPYDCVPPTKSIETAIQGPQAVVNTIGGVQNIMGYATENCQVGEVHNQITIDKMLGITTFTCAPLFQCNPGQILTGITSGGESTCSDITVQNIFSLIDTTSVNLTNCMSGSNQVGLVIENDEIALRYL